MLTKLKRQSVQKKRDKFSEQKQMHWKERRPGKEKKICITAVRDGYPVEA